MNTWRTHISKRRMSTGAALAALAIVAAGCGTSSTPGASSSATTAGSSATTAGSSTGAASPTAIPAPNKKPLTLLFGSSGAAETAAIQQAAAAYTKQSGIKVNVIPASNLTQQLAQDFAGNQPPNLFYLDPTSFQEYMPKGVLASYASSLPNANSFFPSLKAAFSYHGQLVCAPKDGGPLSLYVNNADLKAAGITTPPANWAALAADAKKLTVGGRVGLTLDPNESRIDAFLYQNNGHIFNSNKTKVVIDSKANIQALDFLKGMLSAGSLKFPSALNQGGGTDAFGAGKAAMVVTGNWMEGTMTKDYPNVSYTAYPLPAGPTGTQATLTFTNCWGVAKQNSNLGGTINFVKFLTSPTQELTFAKEFGPVPSLQTLSATYVKDFPQNAAVLNGLKTGHPDIALAGDTQAVTAYSSSLAQLASTSPQTILSQAQTNLQAVINQNNG